MSANENKSKRDSSTTEFVQKININNAKIAAIVIFVLISCYHSFLHFSNERDSCEWLLKDGRYRNHDVWQPYGCILQKYNHLNAIKCFRNSTDVHLAFVGDSRIRQVFLATVKLLDSEGEPVIVNNANISETQSAGNIAGNRTDAERSVEKAHADLLYTSEDLKAKITFHWHPLINENTLTLFNSWKSSPPNLVLAGSGTWWIKLYADSAEARNQYYANLTLLSENSKNLGESKLLWMLQDPVDSEKLSPPRKIITNQLIDLYNEAAAKVFRGSHFKVWESSRLISEGFESTSEDGLHIGDTPLKHDVQALLNFYCNSRLSLSDGSCCSGTEKSTTVQLISFTLLFFCVFLAVVWASTRTLRRRGQQESDIVNSDVETPLTGEKPEPKTLESKNSWQVFLAAVSRLAFIMAYFYLCDRENFFMKENKLYSDLNFWLPVVYIFVLGLFFVEDSRFTKVLHRDQTDEWKGWMQLIILIYHITGASQILPIYMQVRVLVSAYLFLTGYGHFCYFWSSGDRSFVRFCQVLFRMNFMTIVLCLCMNRPYQFYYFVPLVSFWYVVVYVVLVVPCRVTAAICDTNPVHYFYIVLKFIALLSSITVLYMSEVFFERIFSAPGIRALFTTHQSDNIHEWWFRWTLDRYSVAFGMVFAFLYLTAQKHGWIDDQSRGDLLSRRRGLVVAVLSVIGYFGYTTFTFTCRNKPECNEVHPYIVFVPLVSFVLLRNLFGRIRCRYSVFFAWFGRISLELFIGQYHVWLAADTRAVLVLIPRYPVLNVITTSFIFVCVAHEVHVITSKLLPFAVPADWKKTLRSLCFFTVALLAIGIHTGAL